MKSKNTFDYIFMGLKNNKLTEAKKKELDDKIKQDANKFDKAFSDKTYTVAKKVINNVEKLADYDYENFFTRVNKVFDDKMAPHKESNRTMTSEERKKRSEEFDNKISAIKPEVKKVEPVVDYKAEPEVKKAKPVVDYNVKPVIDYKEKIIQKTAEKKIEIDKEKKVIDEVNSKTIIDQSDKAEEVLSEHIKGDSKVEPAFKDIDNTATNAVENKVIEDAVKKNTKKDDLRESKSRQAEDVLAEYTKAKYSKENLSKNSKYYKQKKREKFAKRMSVELEENLIIKKKRSISRLFKFSIAFKLSFVFILLIISTVVTLSVAFYFGIDYVIALKDVGKLDDIEFFKDILLVLLIIFDFIAILLCVSLGTKTSRGLVQPIDEMTNIVKEINANEMDRRLDVKGIHDELRELALTFNEMLDRIESSYDTQNRFTSDASHELRTPIAVIQGYINMLDRWGKADSEVLDESIEAIKSESDNMKTLTEKLLLLAKADKGILELEFKPFELNELISEITRETQMIDSKHTVVNKINDVKTIVADRESLKQAMRIFVDNSVKYTPEGGEIAINSYLNKKNIYIEISDNGIGISKEDMDNIFNRFYRVDSSRTKESGGHGLGLSISKWIINRHKGSIEVKSELGKGTVVTIILSQLIVS